MAKKDRTKSLIIQAIVVAAAFIAAAILYYMGM